MEILQWESLGLIAEWAIRAMDEKHHQRYDIAEKVNMMMFARVFKRGEGNESQ